MASVFVSLPISSTNAAGAQVDVSSQGAEKTIILDGTLRTGAIHIQVSNQASPSNWTTIHTFTQPGKQKVTVAARFMRTLRAGKSLDVSDSPVCGVGGDDSGPDFVTLPVPSSGAGASVDVSALGSFMSAHVTPPNFTGLLSIEASDDDSNWTDFLSFDNPGIKSKKCTVNYLRVYRVPPPSGGISGTPEVNIGAETVGGGGGGGGGAPTYTIVAATTGGGTVNAAIGELIIIDPDTADVTVNLPAIDASIDGQVIIIKNIDDAGTFAGDIQPNGTDTIEFDPSYSLNIAEASITLVADSSAGNWMII